MQHTPLHMRNDVIPITRPYRVVIPRSAKRQRIFENLNITASFDLTDAEVARLDALDGTRPPQ